MKVGIIGYGSMGRRHAANALALGYEVLVYDMAKVAVADGMRRVGTIVDLVKERCAAVVIATPAAQHADDLNWLATLRYDRRVLVEKPLVMGLRDIPHTAGLWPFEVCVGYNLRYHPGYRELWKAREAGSPLSAIFYVNVDGSTWPGAHYADALLECSHEIDLARWILGPMTLRHAVSFDGGTGWLLTLRHVCDVLSTVWISTRATGYARGGSVQLADGSSVTLRWDAPGGSMALSLNGAPFESSACSTEDIYRAELADFLDGGGGCTLQEAVDTLAICDEARDADAQNRR